MQLNPYMPPPSARTESVAGRNQFGRIGFFVSLTGFVGVCATSFGPPIATFAACLAFLSLPGMIISIVGLFFQRRQLAKRGVALGILDSLYLPTIYLSLFGHL